MEEVPSSEDTRMKIIDAHFHHFQDIPFVTDELREMGHENSLEHWKQFYADHDIAAGIIMGNHTLDPEAHQYSEPFYYCVGLDQMALANYRAEDLPDLVEANLRQPRCVGIKLYTGYCPRYMTDPCYDFVYELAAKYHKPVAAHMGMTAGPGGILRYSHPLTMDEAAVLHPDVDFVMCHFGNPFLPDAAAVLEKNDNVYCDLSGLVEGVKDLDAYFAEQADYVQMLRAWMQYVENWDKFMFGTDLPAVEPANYIEWMKRLLPEQHWDAVFFDNANRIYQLGL
jgi:hypothetical protein